MLIVGILIAQTIVFGLVLFGLKKFLWSDTESAVNRLQQSYQETEKKKAELNQKMAEIEKEYKVRKDEADKVAGQIKEKAATEAQSIMDQAFKKAKTEGEEIISNAQRKVESMKAEAKYQAELRTLEFCGGILKRVFTSSASDQIHTALINEFIEEIKNVDTGKLSSEITTVEILTFRKLSDEVVHTIKQTITAKLNREMSLSENVDESLLGGVVVKLGGLVLDNSLSNRINEASVAQRKRMEETR